MFLRLIKDDIFIRCKYYLIVIFSKLLKKYNVTMYFENKIGIKNINKDILKENNYKKGIIKEVDPMKLFIGFDGMNDNYTLVGTSISESPHFRLMKCIDDNGNIKNTDYYYLSMKGALDERSSVYIGKTRMKKMVDVFYQRKKELKDLKSSPVDVYSIDGKLYIIDGKHRAALACLLNENVTCRITDKRYIVESFRFVLYMKMIKNQKLYKKNINFMNRIIE